MAAAAGVFLVIAGHRLKLPSIVLLLAGGVILGPEVLGWVDPNALGHGLDTVISLAVAVILFEGGLTLELHGYRRAPVVIRRLLTVGALVTWFGTGAMVWLLYDLAPSMALMAGSLVIVTGPTVVSPLLRRMHLNQRLHHVLYWEGVLIDAVGVFVAVLCYEWLTPDKTHLMWEPLVRFGLRVLLGVGLGLVAGFAVTRALNRDWVPKELTNIFVLACALLTFGTAHAFLSESGILAVVVAGLVVGLKHPPQLKYVKRFKLQLTELGVGALFILLSAKLQLSHFDGWRLVVLVAVIILILRPLAICLATWGRQFRFREKVFLSWFAPRGIVAAAMASLFSTRLQSMGHPEAAYLETFTYAVILATVTLQGLSAPWLARRLGLEGASGNTWLLLGDNPLVRALAGAMRRAGVKVVEMTDAEAIDAPLDPPDPRLADAQAALQVDTSPSAETIVAAAADLGLGPNRSFRWAPDGTTTNPTAGPTIWRGTASVAAVAQGLETGSYVFDVVEIGDTPARGRFGDAAQPLFWVDRGRGTLIPDPSAPGPAKGDLAVVLRRRVRGLADLIAHVEVIEPLPAGEITFEIALARLATSAARSHPDLAIPRLVEGIVNRGETMSAAIGGALAIPHAYCEGLDRSRCFLAVVPAGVARMPTPDDLPVRLVFLLVSPVGAAPKHLESLAALASLGQAPGFVDLLCRQRVPARLASLINERA